MKKLTLIRHAKSSWEHDVIDHERPLNDKGFKDANNLSGYLKNKNIIIDVVLSSDAIRAKTTADIFLKNLKIDASLMQLNHDLYDFSGSNLIKVVKSCNNNVNSLMVFGHNHAITAFVNTFGNKFIDNVPTCGVVTIEFEIDNWNNLKKGKTVNTLFPRDFKE